MHWSTLTISTSILRMTDSAGQVTCWVFAELEYAAEHLAIARPGHG